MKRRHFLQFANSTLATLGLSQLDIMQQGNKYTQALAQNTGRKFALLVGINAYTNGINPLNGCVNDVLLQKHLLIHRFGFNPKDIKILTDEQATRQNILTTFEGHLINQAKAGDTVVFHFSGHGSQVVDPDKDNPDGLNSTLVPIDSGYNAPGGVVQDIMGHTLFLLMYALKTDNVTVVLDSCHSGGAKRGNFVIRSRDGGNKFQALPQEFVYQKQWLKRLNLSPQEFIKLRRQGIAKGVVIASAKRDQYAADVPFSDFHAGAFTYLFTQHLWQQAANQPVTKILADVNRNTIILSRNSGIFQEPELEINKKNSNSSIYFTPFKTSYAEAVVTQVTGDKVEVWLGGIDIRTIEAFNKDSAFSVVDGNGKEIGLVKLESRQGLIGKGKFFSAARGNFRIQLGTLLQERIRGIPVNLTLKIGLDDGFDSNGSNQAQQALQRVSRITPLPLRQQEIHYIFGRMTEWRYKQLQKFKVVNLPAVGSLGLFLPSLERIVPNSFGAAKESIPEAVQRLQPNFKSLLAARVVKQMVGNNNTSQLKVKASLNLADNKKVIGETLPTRGILKQTGGSINPKKTLNIRDGELPKLPVGTQITFEVENQESVPIYVSILVINSAGDMAIIFPNDWSASDDAALLIAKDKRLVPGIDDGFKLTTGKPFGITEALIIASVSPLRNSLKVLKEIASKKAKDRGPLTTSNDEFLTLTDKLLEDFDNGYRGRINAEEVQLTTGIRGADTKKIAAMTIAFEVFS
jgi:Caspase domain/Domain of unknown function (DUF4384)